MHGAVGCAGIGLSLQYSDTFTFHCTHGSVSILVTICCVWLYFLSCYVSNIAAIEKTPENADLYAWKIAENEHFTETCLDRNVSTIDALLEHGECFLRLDR